MYHPTQIALSKAQVRKLATGGTIHIHHHKVGHGHMHHLTKVQHSKLMRRLDAGRGMRLHMSLAQIKHNLAHGTGFWSGLWDKVKSVAPAALDLGKKALGHFGPKLLEKGIDKFLAPGSVNSAAKTIGTAGIKALTGGSFRTHGAGVRGGSFH